MSLAALAPAIAALALARAAGVAHPADCRVIKGERRSPRLERALRDAGVKVAGRAAK